MKEPPAGLIGVVVPSYNQGRFIESTLQSIIANKAHIPIRLVVIDGGSTDNTVEILHRYNEHIDFWISEPDRGQGHAINKGMAHLTDCSYVAWLNSDDVYDNDDVLARQYTFAVDNRLDVCYGKSYYIDELGRKTGSYRTRDFDPDLLRYDCYISQPSVLIRKSAWDEVGGINEHLLMCLDYELWIKLAHKHRWGYFEQYVGNTRLYPDTKTAKYQQIGIDESIAIIARYYSSVPQHWIASKAYLGARWKNIYWSRIKAYLLRKYYIRDAVLKTAAKGYEITPGK